MSSNSAPLWTCPFCPLACDHFSVQTRGDAFDSSDAGCARAQALLARFGTQPAAVGAEIDGAAAPLPAAIAAGAQMLGAARQPLFAGLGTDVAGARALYALACATGAISDAAGGAALMQGLRALQDRGQFTTTLAEVQSRADLIVFIGGLPGALAPLTRQRLGLDAELPRRIVVLGAGADDAAEAAAWASAAVGVEVLEGQDDLFTTLAWLGVAVAGRALPGIPPALQALAGQLRAARYAVLVGTPARWPAEAALAIEAVHRIVGELNRSTRAAALWIGGGNGAATANQVYAWLSGLPLRSRAGPRGLEHEPHVFDSARLIADRAVDALLWVSSFAPDAGPPASDLPQVVLGHPDQAAACRRRGSVFIPVATPGVGAAGHVFRTDGTVLMPLSALRSEALPGVDEVARALLSALPARMAA